MLRTSMLSQSVRFALATVSCLALVAVAGSAQAAEWGTLIANGRNFLITSPWLSLISRASISRRSLTSASSRT